MFWVGIITVIAGIVSISLGADVKDRGIAISGYVNLVAGIVMILAIVLPKLGDLFLNALVKFMTFGM